MYTDLETFSAQLCYKIGYTSLTSVIFLPVGVYMNKRNFYYCSLTYHIWTINFTEIIVTVSGKSISFTQQVITVALQRQERKTSFINYCCDKQSLVFLYYWEAVMPSRVHVRTALLFQYIPMISECTFILNLLLT